MIESCTCFAFNGGKNNFFFSPVRAKNHFQYSKVSLFFSCSFHLTSSINKSFRAAYTFWKQKNKMALRIHTSAVRLSKWNRKWKVKLEQETEKKKSINFNRKTGMFLLFIVVKRYKKKYQHFKNGN